MRNGAIVGGVLGIFLGPVGALIVAGIGAGAGKAVAEARHDLERVQALVNRRKADIEEVEKQLSLLDKQILEMKTEKLATALSKYPS